MLLSSSQVLHIQWRCRSRCRGHRDFSCTSGSPHSYTDKARGTLDTVKDSHINYSHTIILCERSANTIASNQLNASVNITLEPLTVFCQQMYLYKLVREALCNL